MGTRRAGTVLVSVLVLTAGCAGQHRDDAGGRSPSIPPRLVQGWRPVTATPARSTHPVSCTPATSPRLVLRLRVPRAYQRLRDASGPPCVWVAPNAIVAQISVEITSRSLTSEAADQRNPAKNGRDAGTSEDGSHDIRLVDRRLFGQSHGQFLSYRSDDEGVPLRVLEARVAPLTLSMSVSRDGRALYRSADETFKHVARSLGVRVVRPRS